MTVTLLKDIRVECGFAASVCDKLPADSRVLFNLRGRFDPHNVMYLLKAALDTASLKNLSQDERTRLYQYVPGGKRNRLQKNIAAQGQHLKPFRIDLDVGASELIVNAATYGVDAIALARNVEETLSNETRRTPAYMSDSILSSNSYASVAVVFSKSAQEICVLVQNFVADAAIDGLLRRFSEAARSDRKKQSMMDPSDRPADSSQQPHLGRGGPIGSFEDPYAFLREDYIHSSGRVGIRDTIGGIIKFADATLDVGFEPANFDMLRELAVKDDPMADVRASLLDASAKVGHPQSFTVALRFKLPKLKNG